MAKLGAGLVVTGLTLGAMAAVGLLAFQASGAQDRALAAGFVPPVAPLTSPQPTAPPAPPLPANSGTGLRVVYSLGARQVWLVDPRKNPQVTASFAVVPGAVSPPVGSYPVYSRTAAGTGTDGRKIEHVVRFSQQGAVFGFSAAIDPAPAPSGAAGASPSAHASAAASASADPNAKTGGIRSSRADGQLLWDFAPTGTTVVVVP
ncbi:hypothetical protein AB0K43_04245 [Kitasatospora sp. NPDC049258]|uniref:hypothetical protein n=1 Tax=Kitasatospora sp. NPDC049258 TaxID=3155394 RepID=UPI00342CD311